MHVMQAHILTITHPLRHQSVEAPASPIPKVSMALDHGRPLKFSYARLFHTSKLSFFFTPSPPLGYIVLQKSPPQRKEQKECISRSFASNWTSKMKIKNAIHFSWSHIWPRTKRSLTGILNYKIGVPSSDINHREIWK